MTNTLFLFSGADVGFGAGFGAGFGVVAVLGADALTVLAATERFFSTGLTGVGDLNV